MLLVGTGFTEQTEEQYFQFLAKFEIALPVASHRYSPRQPVTVTLHLDSSEERIPKTRALFYFHASLLLFHLPIHSIVQLCRSWTPISLFLFASLF